MAYPANMVTGVLSKTRESESKQGRNWEKRLKTKEKISLKEEMCEKESSECFYLFIYLLIHLFRISSVHKQPRRTEESPWLGPLLSP